MGTKGPFVEVPLSDWNSPIFYHWEGRRLRDTIRMNRVEGSSRLRLMRQLLKNSHSIRSNAFLRSTFKANHQVFPFLTCMEWRISEATTKLIFGPLPMIKIFWSWEIYLGLRGLCLLTMIFVTILYTMLQRLIGLNCFTLSRLSCFGIRQIRACIIRWEFFLL